MNEHRLVMAQVDGAAQGTVSIRQAVTIKSGIGNTIRTGAPGLPHLLELRTSVARPLRRVHGAPSEGFLFDIAPSQRPP
ncbi:MAG: hypothetical protein ACO3QB_13640 [bacterium]